MCMAVHMIIRHETAADVDAISAVTAAAFRDLAKSRQTEPFIIRALRAAGAMTVSLVAEWDWRVAGHIAFSPAAISDGSRNWYGVGPLSVLPEYQRRGIGTALLQKGFALLKERGGEGCALVGDPNYYKRFGFRNYPSLIHEGIPQEVFLALPFTDNVPSGTVAFHEAFLAEG